MREDGSYEIPGWVVTFGDMMSLLLTFFIMLVSLSEIKEEEQFRAMVESFRRQFGHQQSPTTLAPGTFKPRNSQLEKIASAGRAKNQDTKDGGDKVKAPVGENPRALSVRPAKHPVLACVILFEETSADMTDRDRQQLREQISPIRGKPYMIEIRGHTSHKPPPAGAPFQDNWELAFARCRHVRDYLVNELQLDPARIRLSEAGPNEPRHLGVEMELMKQNSRVEVFQLDENRWDTWGTARDRRQRFLQVEEGNQNRQNGD